MFDSIINELGDYLFLVMFYNWGEPLLNKELPALIRKAKSSGAATEIHTNLSLKLTDEFIEDLLSSGIDDLAASIDGFSPESYQVYRRGGDFELAKANIERLANTRDRRFARLITSDQVVFQAAFLSYLGHGSAFLYGGESSFSSRPWSYRFC